MIEEYASLIALTREYLIGSKKELPDVKIKPVASENIVIFAPNLSPEETDLIQKLTDALTTKVAPATFVTTEDEIGSPRLLITTEIVETEYPTFFLSNLPQYVQDPERKRTLWAEILNEL